MEGEKNRSDSAIFIPLPPGFICENIKRVKMKANGNRDDGEVGWIQLSDAYHHLPAPLSNLKTCTPSQQHEDTLQGEKRCKMKNHVTFKSPAKLENKVPSIY